MFVGEATAISGYLAKSSRSLQQHLFALVRSCNSVRTAIEIHAQIVVNGFSQKNFILVQLLLFYLASDKLLQARRLFETIRNPSTTVWNQMIRSQNTPKSVELFNRMVAAGSTPDGFTYSFLLSACSRAGSLREGEQVHGRVLLSGYCSNVFVGTNLINLYSVEGHIGMSRARKVFDEMAERNVVSWNSMLSGYIRFGDIDAARSVFDEMPERNVVSWTTMVAGCVQNGRCRQAVGFFHKMRRAGVELDEVALVAALSACADLGDLKLGRWIHSYINENLRLLGQPLLISLSNALIDMYASCGVVEEAYEVFSNVEGRNTITWTSMITGFAKQGFAEEALRIFEWMLNLEGTEVRPDEITLLGVLFACSHTGFIEYGRNLFMRMMEEWGIEPKIKHYGCMVDLLSRAGFLDEAVRLIEMMPMKPSNAVWGALLGGCRIHKNDELASKVARKWSVELDTDHASGYLVLLSNVYAIARKWRDVACMRRKLIQMGVKKPRGQSWIQINGVVHDFVAGDQTHQHSSVIYDVLRKITAEAREEVYKPIILDILPLAEQYRSCDMKNFCI